MAGINDNDEESKRQASAYYLAAPAGSREPQKLHNKKAGGEYKSCGMISKKCIHLLHVFLNTEIFCMMTILCNIFHSRNNTIDQEMAKVDNTIKGIFSCDLIQYKFSLNEVYKRYVMRKGYLRGADAAEFNFWFLDDDIIKDWNFWLLELGWVNCVRDTLWNIDQTADGKWFLQLNHNELTLALVQTINSLYDSISLIGGLANWDEWLPLEKMRPRFPPC